MALGGSPESAWPPEPHLEKSLKVHSVTEGTFGDVCTVHDRRKRHFWTPRTLRDSREWHFLGPCTCRDPRKGTFWEPCTSSVPATGRVRVSCTCRDPRKWHFWGSCTFRDRRKGTSVPRAIWGTGGSGTSWGRARSWSRGRALLGAVHCQWPEKGPFLGSCTFKASVGWLCLLSRHPMWVLGALSAARGRARP